MSYGFFLAWQKKGPMSALVIDVVSIKVNDDMSAMINSQCWDSVYFLLTPEDGKYQPPQLAFPVDHWPLVTFRIIRVPDNIDFLAFTAGTLSGVQSINQYEEIYVMSNREAMWDLHVVNIPVHISSQSTENTDSDAASEKDAETDSDGAESDVGSEEEQGTQLSLQKNILQDILLQLLKR
jgi:hypothetical protein